MKDLRCLGEGLIEALHVLSLCGFASALAGMFVRFNLLTGLAVEGHLVVAIPKF